MSVLVSAVCLAMAFGGHGLRAPSSRLLVVMSDDTPTTYADYLKRKNAEAVSEQLKEGAVVYDANADWQRTEGEGGKSTMAQDFQSTDTPDFAPDPNDPRAQIEYTQGMMGSQKMGGKPDHDPGVSQALEVNPEMVAGVEIDGSRRIEFQIPTERWPGDPAAQLSADLDMGYGRAGLCSQLVPPRLSRRGRPRRTVSKIGSALEFEVEPVCMTFEDFYAGWTAESDPAFSVEPTFGRMDKKGGEPTIFKVTCKPDGPPRQAVGYLCVVLPDDGEQWTFRFSASAM